MYSPSSSTSPTVAVRVLNNHTHASSTDASENPWCVFCINLNITTALEGVLYQVASILYVLDLDYVESFTCTCPPRLARFEIALSSGLMFHIHPFLPHSRSTLSFPFPCSLVVLTFRQSLHFHLSLVLADATTAAVFTCTPPPLVLAEAATAAIFARAPLPLVLADAAAAAVFVPLPLVLAEAATAAVLAPAPPPLVLADLAASAVFAVAPHVRGCRGRYRRNLYTCASPSGARRSRHRHSLYACSTPFGARRGCCRRSLCTFSSAGC